PHLRRDPGVLSLARLHGGLRPSRPREHRRLRPPHGAPRHHLRRPQERKVYRRPRPPPGQRPRLPDPRRIRPANLRRAEGPKDRRHLPPLCPHHRQRLARLRHRPRDRTPQRIHGPPQIPPALPTKHCPAPNEWHSERSEEPPYFPRRATTAPSPNPTRTGLGNRRLPRSLLPGPLPEHLRRTPRRHPATSHT